MTVTSIPAVRIQVNGSPLSQEFITLLASVRVQQKLSLPSLCELTFLDPKDPAALGGAFPAGASLLVTIMGQDEALFDGEVTVIEHVYGPSAQVELRVRGYDKLHRLRKRQSLKTFQRVTLADLARGLTSDAGFDVQVEGDDPTTPFLIQHGQSDFDLLRYTAEQRGLYLAARGSTLLLISLQGSGTGQELALGKNLLEARIEISAEATCGSVLAAGWQPLSVEAFRGETSRARVGREIDAHLAAEDAGGEAMRQLGNRTAPSAEQAEDLAQAELDRRVAHEVTLWGVAEGHPALRPGEPVTVQRVGTDLSGKYVLTSAVHTIDGERGYLTEISTLPPAPMDRPSGAGMTLGVVTSVEDPELLGRVQVSLPALGDIQSEWMHVLSPAAGKDKGLAMLPDLGDTVLVLFPLDEPGQGVVLGGLYGQSGVPDSGVVGDRVRRYTLLTQGGQRVILDDNKKRIHLEDSNGSVVELSPDRLLLHAAVDLLVEAPGKKIVIQGQQIDFRKA
ncbi:MAG TPA: phage baseplate assembly protein V [Anaerolineaceae bacterium]